MADNDNGGGRRIPKLAAMLGVGDISEPLERGLYDLGNKLDSVERLLATMDRRAQLQSEQGVPGWEEVTPTNPITAHSQFAVQGFIVVCNAVAVVTVKFAGVQQLYPFTGFNGTVPVFPCKFLLGRGETISIAGDPSAVLYLNRYAE